MDAIEVAGTESVEVIAQFDGAIIDVQHLSAPRRQDEQRARVLIAAGSIALALAAIAFGCAYGGAHLSRTVDVLVAIALGGGTWAVLRGLDRRADRAPSAYVTPARHTLVRVDEAGQFFVTVGDGMKSPLGVGTHTLGRGARTTVTVDNTIFFVANVPAPRRQAPPAAFDWHRELYLGGVTLAASTFLFILYSVPPEPRALALDLVHDNHFARFVITPPEEPPPPPLPGNAQNGSPGAASVGKSGRTGKPSATARAGAIRLPGPVSREKALAMARQQADRAGILGTVAQGQHVGVLFGRDNPLGDGADQILLGLQSAELHDGYGTGTSLVGDGPGGDGNKPATIGVGPLGTVGFCPGCKPGDKSYVQSRPLKDLVHHAKAPDPVPGIVTIKCGENASCLDKEIVRRVIRQHKNEVRFCYELGLSVKPELNGRVVTQFTIANNGRVLSSVVSESSMADRDVEQCIAQAVRRWEFPSTQQMTMVSYPFVLTPPR
jgi:hypothetical protein